MKFFNRRSILTLAVLVISAVVGVFTFRADPDQMLQETLRDSSSDPQHVTLSRLDQILQIAPDHVDTLLKRAEFSLTVNDSLEFLARVHDGNADRVGRARFVEGMLLVQEHRAREAEVSFRESTRLLPAFEDPRGRLIPLMAVQRRPEAVREQLQALRSRRRLTLAEMVLWLTIDGRLTAFEEAITYLEKFVDSDVRDHASLRALCIYLAEETREAEAITKLETVVSQTPDDAESVALLGHLLLDAGRSEEAARLMEGFVVNSETSVAQWRTLGQLALSLGDPERAETATAYAVSRAPFERSTAYRYYRILNALGDTLNADIWRNRSDVLNSLHAEVETVGITILRQQHDPRPVVRVARLLMEIDRPQAALEWIEMARSMGSQDSQTQDLFRQCTEQVATVKVASTDAPVVKWNAFGALRGPLHTSVAIVPDATGVTNIQLSDHAAPYHLDMMYENGHTGLKYLVEAMGGGVGVLDFDNDGWPEFYFPQGGTLGNGPVLSPNSDRLFRSRTGEGFQDVSEVAGISELRYSQGLAVGDINNDGFDDIVVANIGRNTLYLNCGDGTFQDATVGSGLERANAMSSSMALADLDGDCNLDLYVVNYVDGLKICRDDRGQIATCNPSSHEAAADQLFRNLGTGQFQDATASISLNRASGKGLGVIVAQLDSDMQPEIFVANDTTPNFLLRNRSQAGGLLFEELGYSAGVAVNGQGRTEAGMGITCADFNNDQRFDLYVTNFHREANTLLLQRGDGMFDDVTQSAGLRDPTLARLGFGTQAVDLDLDGWMELFVANGHIDNQTDQNVEWKMAPQLFRTVNGHDWSDVSSQCGSFMAIKSLGRAVAVCDANRDAKPDLIVVYQDRPVALLINETPDVGNAIVCHLIGVSCNRSAVNAVVRWRFGDQHRITEITGGDGYYCSNERSVILSLASSQQADTIEILWPDGTVDQHENVAANAGYIMRQGMPLLKDSSR
ncbi:MAG TPA: hypothetical protein EYG03_24915 [Planctomycetes bacterium]|nr:hypothetical protein [Fuerstiella sp.]HIK95197.1 hypothetical protein [Planctomycetota bacterium]